MKISVSNISWPAECDDAAFTILAHAGVEGIEVAPTRVWPDWQGIGPASVKRFRAAVEAAGLRVSSLQAILFQRPELQLFGAPNQHGPLLDHLRCCADLAAELGAECLVFGAPKNRQRGALSEQEAFEQAVDFFSQIAPEFAARGVVLGFEANPKEYGCDFATDSTTSERLVRAVSSPGFRLHVDLACLKLAHENASAAILRSCDILYHYHASQPHLGGFENPLDHSEASKALTACGYMGWVALEMRAADPPLPALKTAVSYVKGIYG